MWSDPIRGQQLAVRLLTVAMQRQRLAQSYLFYGPEGVGKLLTARRLALAVQCEQGVGVGCGMCPACLKLLHDSHPDWHLIEPEGNNIRIDQIRELQSLLARRPHEGRRRIVVLDPAERMNDAAANALLKLLEEPPEESLLILITEHAEALLPTIVSRCQPLRFGKLSRSILEQTIDTTVFGGLHNQKSEARRQALLLAKGSMSRLLEQTSAEKEQDMEERRRHVAWYLEEPRWDLEARLRYVEERDAEWKARESWLELWSLWESLTRDRLILARGAVSAQVWNADAATLLAEMPPLTVARLDARLKQLDEARRQVRAYTSPRLVAEGLLLKWLHY